MATRRRKKNTVEKTVQRPDTRPGRNGGKLRAGGKRGNSGGKKGRSGRPSKRFKSFLADMRQDPTVQRELELLLKDRESRHYAAALKVLTDYDDELPANLTPDERATRIAEYLRIAAERKAAAEGTPKA